MYKRYNTPHKTDVGWQEKQERLGKLREPGMLAILGQQRIGMVPLRLRSLPVP